MLFQLLRKTDGERSVIFWCRTIMTGLAVVVTIWLSMNYSTLCNGFENNANLFTSNEADSQWSNANLLGWSLLVSTIYSLAKDGKFFDLYFFLIVFNGLPTSATLIHTT